VKRRDIVVGSVIKRIGPNKRRFKIIGFDMEKVNLLSGNEVSSVKVKSIATNYELVGGIK